MITSILLVLVLIVTLLAIYFDFSQYRNPFRAVLILLSGALLAGFLIDPEWLPAKSAEYTIATDGTPEKELAKLDKRKLVLLNQDQKRTGPVFAHISSPQAITRYIEPGSRISLTGFGVEDNLPPDYSWNNKLTEPADGIRLTKAPTEVMSGSGFTISGVISAENSDTLRVLRDGTQIAKIPAGHGDAFEFSDIHYTEGPVQYYFEWEDSDSGISEIWNLRVVKPERLTVAVMLYSPSFEIGNLSGHLGNRGHHFSIRTRIGDDRFRFDEMNSPPAQPENLPEKLEQFNLLILDHREFAELSSSGREYIRSEIEKGLDLLLLPPLPGAKSEWSNVFAELSGEEIQIKDLDRLEERRWISTFAEADHPELQRITLLDINFDIPENGAIQTLEEFEPGSPAAIRADVGSGSVSAHLFHRTYRLLQRGETEIYNRLWSSYLDRIITIQSDFLEVTEPVLVVGYPVILTTQNESMKIYSVQNGQTMEIPVYYGGEHPLFGYSVFWPESSGWHRAESGSNSRWFYVYNEDEWAFHRQYETYRNTINQLNALTNSTEIPLSDNKRSVPGWMWLLSFLVIQGMLWAERKLR